MNKKLIFKSIIISMFCILCSVIFSNKVEAASANLSASATEVTVGTQVTVTATVTAGGWNLTLEGAGQSKGLVGQTSTTSNTTASTSINFTPTQSGEYSFSLTGDMTDYVTETPEKVSKTLTVNVKNVSLGGSTSDSNNTSGTTGENTNTPAAKSTEARLKNLQITPNDFTGFRKDIYSYTHEVPNSVTKVKVTATTLDSKAKVTSGNGDVELKEGDNTIKVVVTAEDGKTTKTYTLTIKRRTAAEEEALSGDTSDATLKSLGIKPEEYDFSGFQKDKTEYSVEVPEEVEEIEVYAEPSNSKAQVTGTGKVQLKNGKNKIIVQVTSEGGVTKTYTIEVTRGGTEATATNNEEDGFGLSTLTVNGWTLNPSFKTGTYEYTIELTEDLSALDIEAIATDEDAIIEIIGNENLQQGENTITILVRNEETDETATYQIIVNKNLSAEEKMSWLKPSTWGREEIIKVVIIAVLVILIIVAIILKIKLAKEKNNDEEIDLPGGDELDKALAEHQELADADEEEELETTQELEENDFNHNSSKRRGKHF